MRSKPLFSASASASALALAVAVGAGLSPLAAAQPVAEPPGGRGAAVNTPGAADFERLRGRWVRPDGGYVITIRSADASGRLDATYANPAPLPFAVAQATREGGALKLFFELRAGGYDGSTYTLAYDPAQDLLRGVYYQAVVRQRYDVVFVRAR